RRPPPAARHCRLLRGTVRRRATLLRTPRRRRRGAPRAGGGAGRWRWPADGQRPHRAPVGSRGGGAMSGRGRTATRRADLRGGGALLAGAALGACARGGPTEGGGPVSVKGPAKVELGHYFAQGPRWDLIQSAARRFQEEQPNLTVETQPVTGNYWEALIA